MQVQFLSSNEQKLLVRRSLEGQRDPGLARRRINTETERRETDPLKAVLLHLG